MRALRVLWRSRPASNAIIPRKWYSTAEKIPSNHDHLKRVFDDQKYFKKFNETSFLSERTGLFRNEMLSTPHNLIEFSKKSLVEAKSLVEILVKNDTNQLNYIKTLDQLSDILCRVIDVAEFIRVVHPSEKWVNAAQQTHEIMFEYMNQLNTNVKLWQNLKDILSNPKITQKLTDEEVQVGLYLKQDFERSGIHMDPQTRENFVNITQQISVLGSKFGNGIQDLPDYWCEVTMVEFESIQDEALKKEIKSYQKHHKDGAIKIPLLGNIPYSILTMCSCETLRKKVWIGLHNSSDDQIDTLNQFLKYRAYLAKMLGYKSFSHYQLEHKMAKNPENVVAFLEKLQQNLRENGVKREIETLAKYQDRPKDLTKVSSKELFESVKPWDRDYLLNKYQETINTENDVLLPNINEYFSVGTIVAGLSKLFESIYNVEFIPESTIKGETWDLSQVRKLKVFDKSSQKVLGYLYVDFWSNKVLPSHFTIVCSRKLNIDIGLENSTEMKKHVQLDESEQYQLPIISLVCNFQKSTYQGIGRFAGINLETATLLSIDQVDTIFHEMGHAMHSMIGKTDLHNLSGTRCATDFVELPSVLMESFSKDPRVICEIGTHISTGEKLPVDLFEQYQNNRNMLNECETYMQSKMAILDQKLHDEQVVNNLRNFDCTEQYHKTEHQLQVFSDTWSTWHGKFPHLFSYGAVYYSYLLDRAIAEKIWTELFSENPWSSIAGDKYKNTILKWGGTRDPWLCLADALDNDLLVNGDSQAMEIIGEK